MKVCTLLLVVLATAAPMGASEMHRPGSKHAQVAPLGPKIHVLLEKDAPSALVEAKGSYRVIRTDTSKNLSFGTMGKRFVMQAMQHGLRWGEEYPDVYQIAIIPTSRSTRLSVNGIQYKGVISVYHTKGNRIAIINEVPIEDYLKSTLAVKYDNADLSEEAMAALAIMERTEAYNKALVRTSRPWDVVAREAGYFGSGAAQLKNVETSVNSTRYMVLESLKEGGTIQNPHFPVARAQALAQKGMDAQKILKSVFPSAKIGATISADEVAIR